MLGSLRHEQKGGSPIPDDTLAIIVPVFNEERRLPRLLDSLAVEADRVLPPMRLCLEEVIVVDSVSTDGTLAILGQHRARENRLQVIHLATNRGKGAAVRAGFLAATSEFALVTDVDLSTPLDAIAPLFSELQRGVDMAMGSRALAESAVLVHQPFYRECMGRTFNLMFRSLTGLPWHDTQCGFKLFRRETTLQLFELQRVEGFAYDAELCVNADRLGLRVSEVPVTWRNDADSRVNLVGAPLRMACDLVSIAWRARRPLERTAATTATRRPLAERCAVGESGADVVDDGRTATEHDPSELAELHQTGGRVLPSLE
jgi:dolichyl-phosphate beta-glucosyltransferase